MQPAPPRSNGKPTHVRHADNPAASCSIKRMLHTRRHERARTHVRASALRQIHTYTHGASHTHTEDVPTISWPRTMPLSRSTRSSGAEGEELVFNGTPTGIASEPPSWDSCTPTWQPISRGTSAYHQLSRQELEVVGLLQIWCLGPSRRRMTEPGACLKMCCDGRPRAPIGIVCTQAGHIGHCGHGHAAGHGVLSSKDFSVPAHLEDLRGVQARRCPPRCQGRAEPRR